LFPIIYKGPELTDAEVSQFINIIGSDFTDSQLSTHTFKKALLSIYSTNNLIWVNEWLHTLDAASADDRGFDWIWIDNSSATITSTQYTIECKPAFWDEGSMLRMYDRNLSLHNKNKLFTYFDTTGWFKNYLGEPQFQTFPGQLQKMKGHFVVNADKEWVYTQGTTTNSEWNAAISSNSTDFGVIKEASKPIDNDSGTAIPATAEHIAKATYGGDGIMNTGLVSKFVFQTSIESSATLNPNWFGQVRFYAAARYDDETESLPAHQFLNEGAETWDFEDPDDEAGKYLRIKGFFTPWNAMSASMFFDKRVKGLTIYYTHSEEEHGVYWELGNFDWTYGWATSGKRHKLFDNSSAEASPYTNGVKNWGGTIIGDATTVAGDSGTQILTLWNSTYVDIPTMPKTRTFELHNGYSPNAFNTSLRYKAATIAGRRLFVGNIMYKEGTRFRRHNDQMVYSPVNGLDLLPYPTNILDLDISDGDEIIALASAGDRLMQFKENILYILNISTGDPATFFIENRFKYLGVLSPHHVCETEKGVFWANEDGAYLYDGENVLFLHEEGDNEDERQRKIDLSDWQSHFSSSSLVGIDTPSRQIFVVKDSEASATATDESAGDCYVYNLDTDSWTKSFGTFWNGASTNITNIVSKGITGKSAFISSSSSVASGKITPGGHRGVGI
jgi:hypothetical protein